MCFNIKEDISWQYQKEERLKLEKINVVLISVPGMTECPNCGEYKLSHRVCKNCGSYNGEEVVSK